MSVFRKALRIEIVAYSFISSQLGFLCTRPMLEIFTLKIFPKKNGNFSLFFIFILFGELRGLHPYTKLVTKFKTRQQVGRESQPGRATRSYQIPVSMLRQAPLSHLPIDVFGKRFPGMVGSDGEIGWELYASLTREEGGEILPNCNVNSLPIVVTWDCSQESFNGLVRKWDFFSFHTCAM